MKAPIFTMRVRGSSEPSIFGGGKLPSLNYYGTVSCAMGQSFHHVLHNDPDVTEIEIVVDGYQDLLLDGKEYRTGPGDIFIANPGLWHEEKTSPDRPFRAMFVNFGGLQIAGLPRGYLVPRDRYPVIATEHRALVVEHRFSEIGRALSDRGNFHDNENLIVEGGGETGEIADHLLAALLCEIAEIIYGRRIDAHIARSDTRLVVAAQRFIHTNYGLPLTLADIGKPANLSQSHLCRVFRRATGCSPIEYLVKYRVEAAKEMLRLTDDTVAAIAERVGYQSETHFHTVFRRVAGMPPGRYRRFARGDDMSSR